jgi:hypothetical protein
VTRIAVLGMLLAAPFCVGPAAAQVERTWHFTRSNDDGSLPESVIVHLSAPGDIAVMKALARCTRAALVTAKIDPATGQVSELVGGTLGRDGQQQAFAWLRMEQGELTARAKLPDGELDLATPISTRPWHLYDFDLASLNVWLAMRADRRAGFIIGLPLLLTAEAGPSLRDLGAMTAEFAGDTNWLGQPALLFRLSGPALGGAAARGGTLLLDAGQGHIIDARLPMPNHDGYRDFRLRLVRISDGAAAFAARKAAHWQGCTG